MDDSGEERSRKRVKLNNEDDAHSAHQDSRKLTSSISPPPLHRRNPKDQETSAGPQLSRSPFQLTWVRDLPEALNQDAITLKDILGDPLISECWDFNYLHDLDFLMSAFDEDVRGMVKVHVVHGFWKQEDASRLRMQDQAARYSNLTLHTAYMPEMFGTHHSKMLVLFRHDAAAQVIIHTANMIEFDWTNMTQALWRSPLLPLLPAKHSASISESQKIGSGAKFKEDLLNYLTAYDTRRVVCRSLAKQLSDYDFSKVRAALVASIPGKHSIETNKKTLWGWMGLKNILDNIPVQGSAPEIVIQISSIATLGQTDKWLDKTFLKALQSSNKKQTTNPTFRIIFPTADEVRRSINGYDSGRAIHTKIQTPAQAKQLQYLKPMLCQWAGDNKGKPSDAKPASDAGRKRAAPHIKTYVRFANGCCSSIDWMLVTSANLSKQAWGEGTDSAGDVRICSYEIGVMVWPELYGEEAMMIPTFKSDEPTTENIKIGSGTVVGARMAYGLPLVPYEKKDDPWCATKSYAEPDWKGNVYKVK